MKSGDVTDTLDLALQASGCDRATVHWAAIKRVGEPLGNMWKS
jgi:hypothetical protein